MSMPYPSPPSLSPVPPRKGQLDVGDVCPSGRVRDMSYVAAAAGGGGNGAGSRGSLVAVTSEGGVNVWGVPSLEGVDGEGAGVKLEVPLLATHSIKVRAKRVFHFSSVFFCFFYPSVVLFFVFVFIVVAAGVVF